MFKKMYVTLENMIRENDRMTVKRAGKVEIQKEIIAQFGAKFRAELMRPELPGTESFGILLSTTLVFGAMCTVYAVNDDIYVSVKTRYCKTQIVIALVKSFLSSDNYLLAAHYCNRPAHAYGCDVATGRFERIAGGHWQEQTGLPTHRENTAAARV